MVFILVRCSLHFTIFSETENFKLKGSEQFMTGHHDNSRPTYLASAADFENKKDEEKTETQN